MTIYSKIIYLNLVMLSVLYVSCKSTISPDLPPSASMVGQWTKSSYGIKFISESIEPEHIEEMGQVLWAQSYHRDNTGNSGYGFTILYLKTGTFALKEMFGEDQRVKSEHSLIKSSLSDGRTLFVSKWLFSEDSDSYVGYASGRKGKPDLAIILNAPSDDGLPQNVSCEQDLISVFLKVDAYLNN